MKMQTWRFRLTGGGLIGLAAILCSSSAVAQNLGLAPTWPAAPENSAKVVSIYPIGHPTTSAASPDPRANTTQSPPSDKAAGPGTHDRRGVTSLVEVLPAKIGPEIFGQPQDPAQDPPLENLPPPPVDQLPTPQLGITDDDHQEDLPPPSLETLPDSREVAADPWSRPIESYPVNWVVVRGAEPAARGDRPRQSGEGTETEAGTAYRNGRRLPTGAPLSRVVRRPTPPPPVINPTRPAIVHLPVQIQVIPTYFDFPVWHVPPILAPRYQAPSPVRQGMDRDWLPPHYDSEYHEGGPPQSSIPPQRQRPAGLNPGLHPVSDQPLFYLPDVNLVGGQSNSTDFVSYPHNFLSYPSRPVYGIYIQSFPVSRRLPH